MEPQVLIAFFVMSVLIICVPGPDWAYSIAAGLAPKNYGPSIAAKTPLKDFLRGIGISGLNPKGLLFFVALTPQFIRAEGGFSVPLQSAVLGIIFVATTAVIYTVVAASARRVLRARPKVARVVTLISGVAMIGLGALVVLEQLSPLRQAFA